MNRTKSWMKLFRIAHKSWSTIAEDVSEILIENFIKMHTNIYHYWGDLIIIQFLWLVFVLLQHKNREKYWTNTDSRITVTVWKVSQ